MLKKFLYILFFFESFYSEGQVMFNKSMNFNNIDGLGSIIECDSSFYCSGAERDSYGKRVLAKFDKYGDTVFVKSYGKDSSLYYLGIGKTILKRNQKFYLLGSRLDANTGIFHSNLTITNEQGDSIKSIDVGPVDSSYAQGMIFDRYGDLLISGSVVFSATDGQGALIKCDSLGNVKWIKYYGGPNVESFYSIDTTTDGGYIMAGLTDSYGSGLWDVYVVKVDSGGVFQWHKYFGSTDYDAGLIKSLSNGQYLVYGANYVAGYPDQKAFVRKINSNGNLIWHKNFSNLFSAYEPFKTMVFDSLNNSYVFGGDMSDVSINSGSPVGYFVRTDTSGNQIYYRTYKISDNDNYINDLIISSDNHIVACGFAFPDGIGLPTQDGWIIKLDSVGCLVSGCNVGMEEEDIRDNFFQVYPNPSSGMFTIKINNSARDGIINIANSLGQTIYTCNFTGNQMQINLETNPKGIYFISLKTKEKSFASKIVLE